MDPDALNDIVGALGHVVKLQGFQKNVVDDVLMELINKMSENKNITLDELKRALDGFEVNKVHMPGYKRVKIKYTGD